MEVLSEHNCEGWLEGYALTGRHGLFATYEAFAMVIASHDHPARQVAGRVAEARRGASRCRALNVLLTSTCWRNDHNGFSHQGPGFIDTILTRSRRSSRIYLPPDANCLLWTADHCFRTANHVNLIVIDKQPQLQYLDLDVGEGALRARRLGLGVGRATTRADPDVVMACAGDIPTMETLAAAVAAARGTRRACASGW